MSNAKGGNYQNGDSSKRRQRWAWGCIEGSKRGSAKGSILGRRDVKRGNTKPKEGNIKRTDTKINRWNLGGGAKVSMVVPRSCQGGAKAWGTLRSINQMDAKVGKGKGAKGGYAKRTFSTRGTPKRVIPRENTKGKCQNVGFGYTFEGKPRWAWGCF